MSIIDKRNTEKLDTLLKQKRGLFHINDLGLLWNIDNQSTLRRTISRYAKRGVLVPIFRGFYAVYPLDKIDPLELGTSALHSYSYVSTETVLAQNGIIFQAISAYTFCGVKTRSIDIGDNTYRCRQLKDEYLYNPVGIVEKEGYKIASVERAVSDMLYFNPTYYFDAKTHVDWEKVKHIQKEVGYL